MARWFVRYPGAAPVGPIESAELQASFSRREIPADTMVCAEGFSQWARFDQVAELVGSPPAGSPASAEARPPKRGISAKVVLGIAGAGGSLVLVVLGAVVFWVLSTRLPGPMQWCKRLEAEGVVTGCTPRSTDLGTRSAEFVLTRDKSWGAVTVFDDEKEFEENWKTARTWPDHGDGTGLRGQENYMARRNRVLVTFKGTLNADEADDVRSMLARDAYEP